MRFLIKVNRNRLCNSVCFKNFLFMTQCLLEKSLSAFEMRTYPYFIFLLLSQNSTLLFSFYFFLTAVKTFACSLLCSSSTSLIRFLFPCQITREFSHSFSFKDSECYDLTQFYLLFIDLERYFGQPVLARSLHPDKSEQKR